MVMHVIPGFRGDGSDSAQNSRPRLSKIGERINFILFSYNQEHGTSNRHSSPISSAADWPIRASVCGPVTRRGVWSATGRPCGGRVPGRSPALTAGWMWRWRCAGAWRLRWGWTVSWSASSGRSTTASGGRAPWRSAATTMNCTSATWAWHSTRCHLVSTWWHPLSRCPFSVVPAASLRADTWWQCHLCCRSRWLQGGGLWTRHRPPHSSLLRAPRRRLAGTPRRPLPRHRPRARPQRQLQPDAAAVQREGAGAGRPRQSRGRLQRTRTARLWLHHLRHQVTATSRCDSVMIGWHDSLSIVV